MDEEKKGSIGLNITVFEKLSLQFDGTLAKWTGVKFNYPIILIVILTLFHFHVVKRFHLSIDKYNEKINKFNRAVDIT